MAVDTADLQEVVRIAADPLLTNALAVFDEIITTNQQLNELVTGYTRLIAAFKRVIELVDETQVADYNKTSPRAMWEYISDRATVAQSELDKVVGYTDPGDDPDYPVIWMDSGSGSGSGA